MVDPVSIEAVTFDYWNTLVVDDVAEMRDNRLAAWLGLLEGAGFAIERAALDAAHDSAWQAYQRAWRANEQFTAARTAEHCLDHLELTVPDDLRNRLVDELARSAGGANLRLTDGVADVLRAVKGAGLRLGIVCDVGLTPSVGPAPPPRSLRGARAVRRLVVQ